MQLTRIPTNNKKRVLNLTFIAIPNTIEVHIVIVITEEHETQE